MPGAVHAARCLGPHRAQQPVPDPLPVFDQEERNEKHQHEAAEELGRDLAASHHGAFDKGLVLAEVAGDVVQEILDTAALDVKGRPGQERLHLRGGVLGLRHHGRVVRGHPVGDEQDQATEDSGGDEQQAPGPRGPRLQPTRHPAALGDVLLAGRHRHTRLLRRSDQSPLGGALAIPLPHAQAPRYLLPHCRAARDPILFRLLLRRGAVLVPAGRRAVFVPVAGSLADVAAVSHPRVGVTLGAAGGCIRVVGHERSATAVSAKYSEATHSVRRLSPRHDSI